MALRPNRCFDGVRPSRVLPVLDALESVDTDFDDAGRHGLAGELGVSNLEAMGFHVEAFRSSLESETKGPLGRRVQGTTLTRSAADSMYRGLVQRAELDSEFISGNRGLDPRLFA